MTDMPSTMGMVGRILFLFAYALMFAAVEIEIEGPAGWAAGLPTWFRVKTRAARLYGRLMRGKPLTGYHAVMFVLPAWSFHLGFVSGVGWSWAAEAATLSAYLAWVVTWDFLWFVLNPHFGWRRFQPADVWWHRAPWLARFPLDYWGALVASVALAASAVSTTGTFDVLVRHLVLLAGFALLTLLATAAAPLYQRWYLHMRRHGADERALAGGGSGSKSAESGRNAGVAVGAVGIGRDGE